jgi:hypothetical protein
MKVCPKPHPLAVSKVMAGYLVLSHPESEEFIVLNGLGTRVFALADGIKTVGEIIRLIAAEFNLSLGEARQEVADAMQEMMIHNLLIVEPSTELSTL